jgi:hypothetical protein
VPDLVGGNFGWQGEGNICPYTCLTK